MKRVTVARALAALFLVANFAPPAFAGGECTAPSGALDQADLTTALATTTLVACYPTSGPPWENQETLSGGTSGSITDYKKGPVATGNTDPTKVVGSYSVSSSGHISYTYTGAPAAKFYVVKVSGTLGGAAVYAFYGPVEDQSGQCPLYGDVSVKVSVKCS